MRLLRSIQPRNWPNNSARARYLVNVSKRIFTYNAYTKISSANCKLRCRKNALSLQFAIDEFTFSFAVLLLCYGDMWIHLASIKWKAHAFHYKYVLRLTHIPMDANNVRCVAIWLLFIVILVVVWFQLSLFNIISLCGLLAGCCFPCYNARNEYISTYFY